MVGHMMAVGEETGQLQQMMSKVADFYEAEVDAKVKALTALIEPIMIVFVGGMVGIHRDRDVPADVLDLRTHSLSGLTGRRLDFRPPRLPKYYLPSAFGSVLFFILIPNFC